MRVGKPECRYREKRLLPKARRDRLGSLHKRQCSRMRAKELLNGVGVRPRRIGGNQRIDEVQKFLCSTSGEGVDRMSDDVCMNMLVKVEADSASARARTLIVIGNGWNSREVREAHRHRSRIPPDMRCARIRDGLGQ